MYNVYDSEGVPIGEAQVMPSGALVLHILPVAAGRAIASELVMSTANALVVSTTKRRM